MEAKKLPSGSWRVQVFSHFETSVLPDGSVKKKRIYKSFTCPDKTRQGKRKCEQMAAEWMAKKDSLDSKTAEITLDQALQGYISAKDNIISINTIREYKGLRKNAYESIKGRRISDLKSKDLQIWVNEYTVKHSPKTVRNAYGLLTAAIKFYDPDFSVKVQLPMAKPTELYTPSDSDIKKLLSSIQGTELEIAVYLGAFCAMRMGEICALESSDVDYDAKTITINKSLALGEDKEYHIKSPKTYSSYRTVTAPDFVIERLKGIDGRFIQSKPYNVTKALRRAQKANEIPEFRFHDLRHYAASILHAIGIPDQYIMQYGGWKTDFVMKSVYRNTIDEESQKMSRKISDHFSSII